MHALAAARRNTVALTNLGAFFGKEVTACGLNTYRRPTFKAHRKRSGKGLARIPKLFGFGEG